MTHVRLGTDGNDTLTGSALPSLDANNILAGLGGDDLMDGLLGDDTLFGDRFPTGQVADDGRPRGIPGEDILKGGEGRDKLFGDEGNDTLEGGDQADTLEGGLGFDSLFGGNGDDALDGDSPNTNFDDQVGDYMAGGAGNDTYKVNSIDDIVFENANEGIDSVESSVSYWLTPDVENLTLKLGFFLNGGGNDRNNRITGTFDPNSLYGYGGSDTLYGNWGDDTLDGGEGHDYLYGEDGSDRLIGGEGFDYLHGGTGEDTMEGGNGDDIYVVDNVKDTIIDAPRTGIETVVSYVTWDLRRSTMGAPIENTGLDNLTLTGDAFRAVGNSLNNILSGNAVNNQLYGMEGKDRLFGRDGKDQLIGGDDDDFLSGGAGDDTLLGGAGQDSFYFATTQEGVDAIRDFSVVDDTIQVLRSSFSGLPNSGVLNNAQFTLGAAATTRNHRFIYDSSGSLFFDQDGVGGTAQVQIATLTPGVSLTYKDIFVVA